MDPLIIFFPWHMRRHFGVQHRQWLRRCCVRIQMLAHGQQTAQGTEQSRDASTASTAGTRGQPI